MDGEPFVRLLQKLTRVGAARWVRRAVDPGFVYCFVGSDKLVFEVLSADHPGRNESGEVTGARAVAPEERAKVHGILCEYRNHSMLYLEGLGGWDDLLDLLVAAPIDDALFRLQQREFLLHVTDDLEALARRYE